MAKNIIDKKIGIWTDEEVLTELMKFFERVQFDSEFVQSEEGLVTHQTLAISCGDKVIISEPQPLAWPMQPLPMPEAFAGKLN